MEARHHAAGDVDGQGQPRPAERLAVDLVVDDRVDAGVIDLDDLEGMVGAVLGDDRLEAIARRPIAVPLPPPKLAPKVSTELGTNYRDCGTVLRIKGGAGSSQALDFGSTDCGILTICTQNRPQRRLGRRRWTFPESLPRFTHDNGASRE